MLVPVDRAVAHPLEQVELGERREPCQLLAALWGRLDVLGEGAASSCPILEQA